MSKIAVHGEIDSVQRSSWLARTTSVFVKLSERIMPDPYVFAVLLTLITGLLAYFLVPASSTSSITLAWYNGIFNIFTFAFQMVLIVVTCYALSRSPLVHALLDTTARFPKSRRAALSLTIVVVMVPSWLNWGFGLVAAALC